MSSPRHVLAQTCAIALCLRVEWPPISFSTSETSVNKLIGPWCNYRSQIQSQKNRKPSPGTKVLVLVAWFTKLSWLWRLGVKYTMVLFTLKFYHSGFQVIFFLGWLPLLWWDCILPHGCLLNSMTLLNSQQGSLLVRDLHTVLVPTAFNIFFLPWYKKTNELKLCQDFALTIAWDKEDLQAKNSLEWLPKKQITFK